MKAPNAVSRALYDALSKNQKEADQFVGAVMGIAPAAAFLHRQRRAHHPRRRLPGRAGREREGSTAPTGSTSGPETADASGTLVQQDLESRSRYARLAPDGSRASTTRPKPRSSALHVLAPRVRRNVHRRSRGCDGIQRQSLYNAFTDKLGYSARFSRVTRHA